ncbi:hypothetical protein DOTSEDRAFT_23975 [Dothistroma septosporum NZE10]|uniref:Uncharacterized protein n=1 Tax=Dothistroma septosporum (strain NZE10 / CBS 128990) TaxID=675120 RepID=N1PK10_DOTSN|nr:hypothetical protein DOTSEDRAFT_23975 [Dothistroma septosporum NZE10]
METFNADTETIFDQHTHTFKQMLQLAEKANNQQHLARQNRSFGIDDGLVDILAFIGHKCRDPIMRRQAVDLLLQSNRIDGDRIASTPASIIQAQIKLEEHDLVVKSSQDIPEDRRLKLVAGYQYFDRGHIKLMFVTYPYKVELGAEAKTAFVDLPGSLDGELNHYEADDVGVPDTIVGQGFTSFLEDRNSRRYFHVQMDQFCFPMPKA